MAHAPVYLDYHATTPVDPRVLEAMLPYFTETFGNPASSSHAWGWKRAGGRRGGAPARSPRSSARRRARSSSRAAPPSRTTSRFAASADAAPASRRHIVVSAIEHKSVLELVAAPRAGRAGASTVVPVGRDGRVDLDALERAVDDRHGARQRDGRQQRDRRDPAARRRSARSRTPRGALFHVDAAQAVGKIPIDVEAMQHRSAVAHRPQDVRPEGLRRAVHPQAHGARRRSSIGGGQERGLRSGTLNVPGIVGLGRACAICAGARWPRRARGSRALRDRLLAGLTARPRRRRRQRIARAPAAAQSARQLRRTSTASRC